MAVMGWRAVLLAAAAVAGILLSAGKTSAARPRDTERAVTARAVPGEEGAEAERFARGFRFPGAEVRIDHRRRTIEVTDAGGGDGGESGGGVPEGARSKAGKSIYGKIVVRNRSYDAIDVYWSLDDSVTPWYEAGFLPQGWKLKLNLIKFNQYLLAGETYLEDDGYWDWGPRSLWLRKKFTWTLLP